MSTKYIAFFLAFCMVAGWAPGAQAASEDNRYLVRTNSTFWKNSFGVRHQFDGVFSTSLSDLQVRMARVFGVKIEPVKKFYILQDIEQVNESITSQKVPSDRLPWGVQAVYENNGFARPSGGKDVSVAVLDTGVFVEHPDLKARIAVCKDATQAKGILDGVCEDTHGHGTHVAGIIAADGGPKAKGIIGVAPQAELWAYKVCNADGLCWADDIAAAIRSAVHDGVNIIHLSLGGDHDASLVRPALDFADERDVLVIAGAGNDGPFAGSMEYPAAYESVIGVGALDVNFAIPEWSSRGTNLTTKKGSVEEGDIEFAAPGVTIESTWHDGGYVILSGTSTAAPHITGLAAKMWKSGQDSPLNDIRLLLRRAAFDVGDAGEDDATGFGFPQVAF